MHNLEFFKKTMGGGVFIINYLRYYEKIAFFEFIKSGNGFHEPLFNRLKLVWSFIFYF